MGSPETEKNRRPDEGPVDVTLTRGFWAGKFEVTQGQWRRLSGGFPDPPPSAALGEGAGFPLYWVNFDEAAWVESVAYNRSATRLLYEPPRRSDHIGFRAFLTESHGDVEGMVSAQRPPAGAPIPADTTLRRTAR